MAQVKLRCSGFLGVRLGPPPEGFLGSYKRYIMVI